MVGAGVFRALAVAFLAGLDEVADVFGFENMPLSLFAAAFTGEAFLIAVAVFGFVVCFLAAGLAEVFLTGVLPEGLIGFAAGFFAFIAICIR